MELSGMKICLDALINVLSVDQWRDNKLVSIEFVHTVFIGSR